MNLNMDVLVVDDDAFTRQGICVYLESLHFCAEQAGSAAAGWQMALERPFPLAIIDILLPDNEQEKGIPQHPHGITLAVKLKEAFPTMGVVLLSAHARFEREVIGLAQQFMRSVAFLHKGGEMSRLPVALKQVQAGRTFLPPEGVNRVVVETAVKKHIGRDELPWVEHTLSQLPQLTPREQDIGWLLATSYTPEAIAQQLYLAKGSVENHITQIYRKLGLADIREEGTDLRPLPILVKACLLYDIRHS